MKYLLKIAYDGRPFAGFQRQPNVRTVQSELESALSTELGERVRLTCAGRTDKGVHGLGQVVSFKLSAEQRLEPAIRRINNRLSSHIQILNSAAAPVGFHVRHSAITRTYRYHLRDESCLPPEGKFAAWEVQGLLNVSALEDAAGLLVGTHDFSSFSFRCGRSGNERHLVSLDVEKCGHLIVLKIRGEGFLRKMVRLLVADIVAVGLGRLPLPELQSKLERPDPETAPHPAPPHGLYLASVEYPTDPFVTHSTGRNIL